ncbi:MAG: 4-alpha-glucanotransferase [Haliea sp.]|nr:4-alpha-glucanotransferase [Haliea sp.]
MRQAGVLLHPTSLPGPGFCGDFGADARRFVDLIADAGLRIWQVLPLGPTHPDGCPYQCFSVHAGNPDLIDLQWLVERGLLSAEQAAQGAANPMPNMDYSIRPATLFLRAATRRRHRPWRRIMRNFCRTVLSGWRITCAFGRSGMPSSAPGPSGLLDCATGTPLRATRWLRSWPRNSTACAFASSSLIANGVSCAPTRRRATCSCLAISRSSCIWRAPTCGRTNTCSTSMSRASRSPSLAYHRIISAPRDNSGAIPSTTGSACGAPRSSGGCSALIPRPGSLTSCVSITSARCRPIGRFRRGHLGARGPLG